MQISHRASELLHNIFNSENILKVQAQVFVFGNSKRELHTPYTNRLCLKWQSIYAFLNLKRKRCFVSSHRKAHQAETQLTKQTSRALEVKNKALLKAYPRINRVYFRSQYHNSCLCVASTALSSS